MKISLLPYRVIDKVNSIRLRWWYRRYRLLYEIDSSFRFNGYGIYFHGPGRIVIGPGSYMGSLSTIQAAEGCRVQIGKSCLIAYNVRIYSSTAVADQDFSCYPHQTRKGDVIIGDNVWIGVNAYIGPGVVIGDNTVVAANSVVTRSVPGNAIVGGSPAVVLKFKKVRATSSSGAGESMGTGG